MHLFWQMWVKKTAEIRLTGSLHRGEQIRVGVVVQQALNRGKLGDDRGQDN